MDRLSLISLLASLATIAGLGIAAWQFKSAMDKDAEARLLQVEMVIQSIDAELIVKVASIDRRRSEASMWSVGPEREALTTGLAHEIQALDAYVVSIYSLSSQLQSVAPRLMSLMSRVCEYLGQRDYLAGEYTDQYLVESQNVCARL